MAPRLTSSVFLGWKNTNIFPLQPNPLFLVALQKGMDPIKFGIDYLQSLPKYNNLQCSNSKPSGFLLISGSQFPCFLPGTNCPSSISSNFAIKSREGLRAVSSTSYNLAKSLGTKKTWGNSSPNVAFWHFRNLDVEKKEPGYVEARDLREARLKPTISLILFNCDFFN